MKRSEWMAAFAGLALITAILLTAIDTVCFQTAFYRYEYTKNETAELLNMSDTDLMSATQTLLDYLRDKRDDIVITAEVNGIQREVFDKRETLHMADVKELYQNALKVRNILTIFGISALIVLLLKLPKQRYTLISSAYKFGLTGMGVLLLATACWAIVDFNGFWMNFHYLFFDNDLFLLDPSVSVMINMFPSNFFFAMVMCIILFFLSAVGVLGLALLLYKHQKEKVL